MYEDGTPLKNAVSRGVVAALAPELEASHYLTVMETLENAGWRQYEDQQFCAAGFRVRAQSALLAERGVSWRGRFGGQLHRR